jgi:hypothetical protein
MVSLFQIIQWADLIKMIPMPIIGQWNVDPGVTNKRRNSRKKMKKQFQ